jgi:L-seryl-tRNA(Ser) seleniumtransferase
MTLRAIPSIEQLRQRESVRQLEAEYGHRAVVQALRDEASLMRERVRRGHAPADVAAEIADALPARLRASAGFSLSRVLNATGVIVHTNLGRAPLAAPAAVHVAAIAAGYTNLEYDLERGGRGRRDAHAERLLCALTGAAAAVVANNNAAATLLVLAALAGGREVLISRGELVEIGGGFRVPDVMAQSGAVLREVGTTNRTRAADYAAAIGERTGMILRVHPSNFRIVGFAERAPLEALVALGRRFRIPVVEDLGSGLLDRLPSPALRDEPAVRTSLEAGADAVMFSGDKLLGGPQCGIVAGRADAVGRVRSHPLMRALRVDKMTYAALEATLAEYAAGRAAGTIPVQLMIAATADAIDARARTLVAYLAARGIEARVGDGMSTIGGGSAPGSELPTRLLALAADVPADVLLERLRRQSTPVIGRIENDVVVLDLRTVAAEDDELLGALVAAALTTQG